MLAGEYVQQPYTNAPLCALQALFLATLCLFVSSLAFLIFPKVSMPHARLFSDQYWVFTM